MLPKPYLDRNETDIRLEILGFEFYDGLLVGGQEEKLMALEELISGAIAEWADVKDDFGSDEDGGEVTPERVTNELQEFAEEYLVG
jgi:hypothetical protein